MSDEELLETAEKLKAEGNANFKIKNYEEAIGKYGDALSHADTIKSFKNNTEDLKKLKIACLQNMSICTNSIGDYKSSVRNCSKAIGLDNKAQKAYYLRSVAYM